ncbi:hypothetical protein BGX33_007548 [Mortierella sp. NVP41]|nr:hypothetical protein BGX33_007548 [Mortierella sp. NVP41]
MYTLQHATDALKAYDSKPDCFKEAARALRQGCKSIDIDEDEKTRYAIRLTACEIATANMPVPQECHLLATAENNLGQQPTTNDVGRCVQSLGRIPQLWTSYSGNFREVKVMCLAVRYSLEHDELRRLQRNLSRTHSDQIVLLKEQQRVLTETSRLETERLKELSDLHSTIATEVNSMLYSAGTLRDALRSVTEEVSKLTQSIEKGALQQSAALSTTQESNNRILSEYQHIVHSTLAMVSQSIHQWHDSLQLGLSRANEIDRLSEDSIFKISQTNEAMDFIVHDTEDLKDRLLRLTRTAVEGTHSLLELHDSGAHQINASTKALLQETLQSLLALEAHSQSAWNSMLDSFKEGSASFQSDVAHALEATVLEVEQMAAESQEKMERLNIVVMEFWKGQESVLGQIRPLYKTWSVVKRVVEGGSVGGAGAGGGGGGRVFSWMGLGRTPLFFLVVGIMTLINGLRTALVPMVASVVIMVGCEWWRVPTVSFVHLFMGIICLRWYAHGIRSWHYYYSNRHQSLPWQCWNHLRDRWQVAAQHQQFAIEQSHDGHDVYEDEVGEDAYYGEADMNGDSAEDTAIEEIGYEKDYDDEQDEGVAWLAHPSSEKPSKPTRRSRGLCIDLSLNKQRAAMLDMISGSWDLTLGSCVCTSSDL